eukprot:jgi/Psemu1/25413/gm1.25413_g
MKFAIAYVIGNTELHDKLCGKYGSFNKGVMRMCRHCNCYSPNINIPSVQPATKKRSPADFHCFPGTDLVFGQVLDPSNHSIMTNVKHGQLNLSPNSKQFHLQNLKLVCLYNHPIEYHKS